MIRAQNHRVAQATFLLPLLLSPLFLSGCFGSGPVREDSSAEEAVLEVLPTDEFLNISKGERDTQNQFPSTVYLGLSELEECGGVLIHPRLVLTAAHCVCRGRKDKSSTIIDTSTCQQTVSVQTGARYEEFRPYAGKVRPHRDFRILLKKKKLLVPPHVEVDHAFIEAGKRYVLVDVVAESTADLAVIVLDRAAGRQFPPAPLAGTGVQVNDRVVVTGYGADAVESGFVSFTDKKPIRRFGMNVITKVDGDLFMIEPPGALALPGDSGGPCFREESTGRTLVGISSRSTPGKRSTFTSTYRYRSWLEEEIKQINAASLSKP